ncbi:hypothetical protein NK356_06135 [Chryseobacterium sp. S0630]|uniref:hypothetical protein n=1 Tax=Chryseobacterium sp. S0630 TaxID=2957803 RepID=UPI00209C72F4|nr:hypothetical protein [Chryseobacterium sp. S0630]MCP1298737.1 hypothetical protein [Chryseobacterium sp. S0630]
MDNIIKLADKAKEELAKAFVNKPEIELWNWLNIGLRREGLVSELYKRPHIEKSIIAFPNIGNHEKDLIITCISQIWAQETSHQKLLDSFFKAVIPPTTIIEKVRNINDEIMGRLEGFVTAGIIAPKNIAHEALAKIGIVMGRLSDSVPDFINDIDKSDFSVLCDFSASLEYTAQVGYARMVELIERLPNNTATFGLKIIKRDLEHIYREELYHNLFFKHLTAWLQLSNRNNTVNSFEKFVFEASLNKSNNSSIIDIPLNSHLFNTRKNVKQILKTNANSLDKNTNMGLTKINMGLEIISNPMNYNSQDDFQYGHKSLAEGIHILAKNNFNNDSRIEIVVNEAVSINQHLNYINRDFDFIDISRFKPKDIKPTDFTETISKIENKKINFNIFN